MAQNINKDAVYRAAKPNAKDYFINDGCGLYLFVRPPALNYEFCLHVCR